MIPQPLIDAVKKRRLDRLNRTKQRAQLGDIVEKRKKAAWHEALRLVEEFKKEDPALQRIILFGSLAKDYQKPQHKNIVANLNFDIDLAFIGREYYHCVAISLNSTFKVDLVDYNTAPSHIREEIDANGRILYDSNS